MSPDKLASGHASLGWKLARGVVTVAHDQAATGLVTLIGERGDLGVDLGLERFGEYPAGAFADQFVDQRGRDRAAGRAVGAIGGVRDYGEYRVCLPDRRRRVGHA
ncbi:hypothetical protein [Nonomuraea wenchangensis]|uniref:hypothetical protein n=1 Tax=Nonomuraea wenchangensis TaxID=568860 RepID=UPI0015A52C40